MTNRNLCRDFASISIAYVINCMLLFLSMKASPPTKREGQPGRRPKTPVVPASGVQEKEATTANEEQTPQSTTRVEGVILNPEGEMVMAEVQNANLVNGTPILNGVKAAGEAFAFPGASLVIDGNIKGAALHIVGASAARVLFGPIGWFYFAADSFSKSVSGKNLHEYFVPSKTA
jgi:hypothetical protein